MNPASRLLVFSDCRLTSVFPRSSTQLKAMSGTLVGQRGPGLATLRSVKSGGEGGGGRGGSFQNFTKDLGGCSASWRAVAIFFIVVTIAMASTLAFVLASSLVSPVPTDTEIAAACAVVDTNPSDNNVLAGIKLDKTSLKQGPGTYLISSHLWKWSFISIIQ